MIRSIHSIPRNYVAAGRTAYSGDIYHIVRELTCRDSGHVGTPLAQDLFYDSRLQPRNLPESDAHPNALDVGGRGPK